MISHIHLSCAGHVISYCERNVVYTFVYTIFSYLLLELVIYFVTSLIR